jgi:hypothetical protein
MLSARRNKQRENMFFYGGLAVFLILLYGGAAFLQALNSSKGQPFEGASDIAVPVLIGAFVGRKFGIGWGALVGVTIAAFAQISSHF